MSRRPPRSTRTDPRCPYPTRFRSFGLERTATGRVAFLGKFCVANAVGAEMPEILPKLAPGNDHAADIEIADRNRPDGSLADAALFVLIADRSEEHTSELQSLMRISYAVFCLKKKNSHSTNDN